MKVFSTAISSGALGLCTSINLGFNNIGDVGMQAMAYGLHVSVKREL
jgi:hypothetical protein